MTTAMATRARPGRRQGAGRPRARQEQAERPRERARREQPERPLVTAPDRGCPDGLLPSRLTCPLPGCRFELPVADWTAAVRQVRQRLAAEQREQAAPQRPPTARDELRRSGEQRRPTRREEG